MVGISLPLGHWGIAAMIVSVLLDKEEQVGVSSPAIASSRDPSVPCNAGAYANMPESLEIGLNQWSRSVYEILGVARESATLICLFATVGTFSCL